jgi:hypothetical protein
MRLVGCYGDPGPLLNPEMVKTVSTEPIGFAELRALAHPKVSFAMDSALEGGGFEPSVPR